MRWEFCGCWDWIRRLLQVKSDKIRDSWGLEYSYLGRDGVGVLLVSDLFGTLRSMDDAIHDRLHVHKVCIHVLTFSCFSIDKALSVPPSTFIRQYLHTLLFISTLESVNSIASICQQCMRLDKVNKASSLSSLNPLEVHHLFLHPPLSLPHVHRASLPFIIDLTVQS